MPVASRRVSSSSITRRCQPSSTSPAPAVPQPGTIVCQSRIAPAVLSLKTLVPTKPTGCSPREPRGQEGTGHRDGGVTPPPCLALVWVVRAGCGVRGHDREGMEQWPWRDGDRRV